MWGTWWEWGDPRMMSELILLFLYFGYMALRRRLTTRRRPTRQVLFLALVGVVNVVIVHFSVRVVEFAASGPDGIQEGHDGCGYEDSALIMLLGFTLLFGSMLLRRTRTEVLFRERRTRWVREMILSPEGGQVMEAFAMGGYGATYGVVSADT